MKFKRNTKRRPEGKPVDRRKRGGGIKKEKTQTRNGGVKEAESFKKNGPILYFSRNAYLLLIPAPLLESFI